MTRVPLGRAEPNAWPGPNGLWPEVRLPSPSPSRFQLALLQMRVTPGDPVANTRHALDLTHEAILMQEITTRPDPNPATP